MINYRYYTFLTVCQTLNYTLAAKQLHITQPAVSNHIAYLENKLAVVLFTHYHHKVQLTPAGKLLYSRLSFLDNYSSDTLKQLTSLNSTAIRIGYSVDVNTFKAEQFIENVLAEQSEIELELEMNDTDSLITQIEHGAIHGALITGPFDHPTLSSSPLYQDNFILLTAIKSKFIPREDSVEYLECTPLIVQKKVFQILEHHLPPFKQKVFINNLHFIKDLVKKDIGITFTLERSVRQDLDMGRLKKIKTVNEDTSIMFIYLEKTPLVKSILELIKSI